tara:strand:- start:379 stop:723 length:345 start_codon:yes stop_codon:yes gene_type:complete
MRIYTAGNVVLGVWVIVCLCLVINGCHTSSSERRRARERDCTRTVEEWVHSPAGREVITGVLTEDFEILLWNELKDLGPFGGASLLAALFGGGWFGERIMRKNGRRKEGAEEAA